MFEGFEERLISTRGARIFALTGGVGPPLLLLHGYPQSHVMWHAVAPLLRARFSLVIPDLRGYGASSGPAPDPQHLNYSKRAMAADMVELMSAMGHERFALAGHDRGGRVAYRLVLDHPASVVRLAVLDIIPTFDMWERMNGKSALGSYHWLLLAQPPPLPERLIGSDPQFFLHHLFERWAGRPEALKPEAIVEYRTQLPPTDRDRSRVRRLPSRRHCRSRARSHRPGPGAPDTMPDAGALGTTLSCSQGRFAHRGLAFMGGRCERDSARLWALRRRGTT